MKYKKHSALLIVAAALLVMAVISGFSSLPSASKDDAEETPQAQALFDDETAAPQPTASNLERDEIAPTPEQDDRGDPASDEFAQFQQRFIEALENKRVFPNMDMEDKEAFFEREWMHTIFYQDPTATNPE